MPNIHCLIRNPVVCKVCERSIQQYSSEDTLQDGLKNNSLATKKTIKTTGDPLAELTREEDASIPLTSARLSHLLPRFNKNKRRNTSMILQFTSAIDEGQVKLSSFY